MKKFNKNLTPILLIVAAIVVVGGIYYYSTMCSGVACTSAETNKDILGWTKYSNAQFGYSFYYPSEWKVTESASGVSLSGVGSKDDTISITEVTGDVVQDVDNVNGKVVYFYDANTKTWKMTGTVAGKDGKPIQGVQKATPSFTTVSALPVLPGTRRSKTNIVSVTSNKFVIINITGSGYTAVLDALTKTVHSGTADMSKLKAAVREGEQALKAK